MKNARCGCCLLILSLLPAFATGQPDPWGGGWRMTRLDLDVTVLPEQQQLRIAGEMDLVLDLPESLGPTIAMNTRKAVMSFTDVRSSRDAAIEINQSPPPTAPPLLANTRMAQVRFTEPAVAGTEVTLSFSAQSAGESFQLKVENEAALASWTQGWYPVPLPAPGEPIGAYLGTASGTTTFHLPRGWHSVSNGQLITSEQTGSMATEVWNVNIPAARSFVAAAYRPAVHEVGDREVGVYLLGEHPESAAAQAGALAAALAAMEARLGPYPYPTYAIAEVPDDLVDWYASSEQGFVMAASRAFGYSGGNLPLFAHEMAHGWWGNLVSTTGEGSIMVSEALAQYSAVVAIETVEGQEAATEFLRFSREGYNRMQSAWGLFEMWRRGESKPLSALESGGWQHNLADAKGHWVYHMLRRRVGDEVFFATLRGLIDAHAGSAMSLDDLRLAFIDAAPAEADLETFFAQWLDRPGAPIIDMEWWIDRDQEQRDAVVTLTQENEPYHLFVDVAIETEGREVVRTIEVRDAVTRVVFDDLPDDPIVEIRLDPNHELLLWTPQYGAPPGETPGDG